MQDYPIDDHRMLSSHGYRNNRKDFTNSPRRGQPDEVRYSRNSPDRERWEIRDTDSREYERSRSPRREGRGRYTDRDRENYVSPRRERSRSRSPYYGAPPNRNVILEGLPLDFTQEDIFNELKHDKHVEGLEEVRVIKDKRTGQPRGFAFAQFVGIPEAKRFLQDFYPNIFLRGVLEQKKNSAARPAKVRIAYSRERDDREKAGKGEDDWKCDICCLPNFSHRTLCFRCNAPRTRSTAQGIVMAQGNQNVSSGFVTTGDSDASPDGTASQFLLFRGLEPGVTEELLAKGVRKLLKAKAENILSDASVSKKSKSCITANDTSLGAREMSMRRVLLVRDRKTNDSWRYGFAEFSSVEDAQAAMTKYKSLDKFTIASKPVLAAYIHAGVFVPIIHPLKDEDLQYTFNPLSSSSVKLMYWDEAAYASELVTATDENQTTLNSKLAEGVHLTATTSTNEGLIPVGKNGEPRPKKRKAEKDTKIVAPHLQFWTNRHAELHGLPLKENENILADTVSDAPKTASLNPSPTQSFADLNAKCCLLCRRQFKTEAEVHKHERLSKLHLENLKDKDLIAKALTKLGKSAVQPFGNSNYRDRAMERRRAFNQPKNPIVHHNRPAATVKKDIEEPPAVPSKGATLLGKMGWTAGEGLGLQGTGRTEVISTDLYAQGVGLGAAGGKIGDAAEEAQRQTKSTYADFLSKTKDKAKERFKNLG
ncbi:putative RNA-binding protein C57A7.13 [Golovinomyces cichoracearum]|uniref:Putative RNA-binding protein C57A7.13 n=1 Tax=Golovinomyces cichoracearum TaxID=62708 RepID=A0A420IB57_9PEZI|nr:putative RNA-binding protein C57A7.13 [Golovinomyces cichoracearum]